MNKIENTTDIEAAYKAAMKDAPQKLRESIVVDYLKKAEALQKEFRLLVSQYKMLAINAESDLIAANLFHERLKEQFRVCQVTLLPEFLKNPK